VKTIDELQNEIPLNPPFQGGLIFRAFQEVLYQFLISAFLLRCKSKSPFLRFLQSRVPACCRQVCLADQGKLLLLAAFWTVKQNPCHKIICKIFKPVDRPRFGE
jgi:hypothetical protein